MKKVVEVMKKALGVSESEITNIRPFGGMTNINYLASVGDEHYIVRMPGLGTKQLINRREEKKILKLELCWELIQSKFISIMKQDLK